MSAAWILNTNLFFMYVRLYDTAIRLGKLQAELKVQVDPEEYARENLKFGLVEVVYEWAKVSSLPFIQTYIFYTHHFN